MIWVFTESSERIDFANKEWNGGEAGGSNGPNMNDYMDFIGAYGRSI